MANRTDNRTLGQVTADLARRWASQRLGAVQAYGRILADYGAGRSSSTAAAGAYAKLLAEEGVRYPADAMALATDFAAAMFREAGGRVTTPPGRPAVKDLDMSGPLGGEASAKLSLHNPHDQAASLSITASPFAGASGGGAAATVVVEPPSLVLQPGDEQEITLRAQLDPAVFEAGGRYTANLAISGFDDLTVRVRLSVLSG